MNATREAGPVSAVERADQLESEGRFLDAARALETLPRDERDPAIDTRAVALRHRAFHELDVPPSRPILPADIEDRFPECREIPEADARDLDGDLMRSALAHHGALIVRGLLDSATCARIRADIDEAFEAADQAREQRLSAIDPWYADFPIDGEFTPLDPVATIFLRSAGGVYAPHSPRAFLEYRRALDESGILGAVEDVLHEIPIVSVNKCVLRRIGGGAQPSWHQDGSYLGTEINAVNLWMSLSRCGGDSDTMGLDILSGRQHQLAEMGGYDAIDPRAISNHVVEQLSAASGRPIVRPLFEPGDGIFFDHLFIHRSDVRPLPALRYAIESWFFGRSTYPDHQIPVVAG